MTTELQTDVRGGCSVQRMVGRHSWALVYHGDCRDVLPEIECDAIVSDPPYGCRYVGSPGTTNGSSIHTQSAKLRTRETVLEDDADFDPSPLLKWPCALSGAGHYYDRLPKGGSLHSWDKRGDYKRNSFADADIVWCSRKMNAQTFRLVWRGLCRHAEHADKILHPTQKPVAMMMWMLSLLEIGEGQTVCDPYMGSGSTAIACARLKVNFIGIERDAEHYKTACDRIAHELDGALL